MNENLPKEVKWRGSAYIFVKVEDGKVYWTNATSRHCQTCSIDAWKKNDPYDGHYA
jgi:hypothetical protein